MLVVSVFAAGCGDGSVKHKAGVGVGGGLGGCAHARIGACHCIFDSTIQTFFNFILCTYMWGLVVADLGIMAWGSVKHLGPTLRGGCVLLLTLTGPSSGLFGMDLTLCVTMKRIGLTFLQSYIKMPAAQSCERLDPDPTQGAASSNNVAWE